MQLGITGGIGCGKSTAAKIFEKKGFNRIDCDEIVHDLLEQDSETISTVADRFGESVIKPEGGVDRRTLGQIVFADKYLLKELEDILHPKVRDTWTGKVNAENSSDWVVEVPLLFEKNLQNRVDFTICVFCHQDLQVERLERKGIERPQALARINQQLPLSEKAQMADLVLLNDGSFEFLESQINSILKSISR